MEECTEHQNDNTHPTVGSPISAFTSRGEWVLSEGDQTIDQSQALAVPLEAGPVPLPSSRSPQEQQAGRHSLGCAGKGGFPRRPRRWCSSSPAGECRRWVALPRGYGTKDFLLRRTAVTLTRTAPVSAGPQTPGGPAPHGQRGPRGAPGKGGRRLPEWRHPAPSRGRGWAGDSRRHPRRNQLGGGRGTAWQKRKCFRDTLTVRHNI